MATGFTPMVIMGFRECLVGMEAMAEMGTLAVMEEMEETGVFWTKAASVVMAEMVVGEDWGESLDQAEMEGMAELADWAIMAELAEMLVMADRIPIMLVQEAMVEMGVMVLFPDMEEMVVMEGAPAMVCASAGQEVAEGTEVMQ
jgi:hypothetical protein